MFIKFIISTILFVRVSVFYASAQSDSPDQLPKVEYTFNPYDSALGVKGYVSREVQKAKTEIQARDIAMIARICASNKKQTIQNLLKDLLDNEILRSDVSKGRLSRYRKLRNDLELPKYQRTVLSLLQQNLKNASPFVCTMNSVSLIEEEIFAAHKAKISDRKFTSNKGFGKKKDKRSLKDAPNPS